MRCGSWAQGTGHEAGPFRMSLHELLGSAPGHSGPGDIQLVGELLHAIIGQGHGRGIKGVRLDDIGTRLEVFAVNAFDDPGLGDRKNVVVASEIPGPILEPGATECGFIQVVHLDHGAHGTIQNDNALLQETFQGVRRIV